MKKNGRYILIAVVAFAIGFGLHWAEGWYFLRSTELISEKSIRIHDQYPLISPLLICGTSEPKDFGEYQSFDSKIRKLVTDAKTSGQADEVSVYFRDFQGKWVGINENEPYAPASLLKLPLMIAYYKKTEANPTVLEEMLTYDGTFNDNTGETFTSPYDITPGVYKVKDLLKAMIVNSDNNATRILTNNIDQKSLSDVYTDLGLSVPPIGAVTANSITAKQYSYFFRILFNATYLSPETSEGALEILEKANFPQGIRAGVPEKIPIAQKFGERTVLSPGGEVQERQLHDCGIIYYPQKTYFLCIMTRGKDFKGLLDVMRTISTAVYEEVDARPSL